MKGSPSQIAHRWRRALVSLALGTLAACGAEVQDRTERDVAVDHSDPRSVMETVFKVARGEAEATVLAGLCDPLARHDLDVRRICDYAAGFDPSGEFPMFFAEGKLVGEPYGEGDRAWIPFVFGPEGNKIDTMELVQREGKWYLEQF